MSSLIKPLEGNSARNVKLGHGSFITIDFGENRAIEISTKKGIIHRFRGEWHLWTYMCAWRLDKEGKPHIDIRRRGVKGTKKFDLKEK